MKKIKIGEKVSIASNGTVKKVKGIKR